jgi:hypothetical protein
MLRRMRRGVRLAIGIGGAAALLGCDAADAASSALAVFGRPTFREVDAGDARRWLEHGDALLLQAQGDVPPARRVAGAELVAADGPLAESPAERRIVIVSEEPELGLRLGARLARAGRTHVAVVSGGLPRWETGSAEE